MRSNWRRIALIGGFVILGLIWIQLGRAPADSASAPLSVSPRIGFLAPDFTLDRSDGETVTLSDLQGQAVILNFWATWCAPCRAEMPALERVYQARRDNGLVILGVNQMEPKERVERFLAEVEVTFPIALDLDAEVGRIYRVHAMPTTYFIDRQGVIRDVVIGGPLNEALLQSKIGALLGE
jgi:cytochrome c biogenesis protein CcmG/thiol:disulfide interchange protein DsbE